MSEVIVTIKIMPDSPETNLKTIEKKAVKEIESFGGRVGKVEQEPVAFGIKSLNLFFFLDENKSNLDPLEEKLRELDNVQSAEVVDVRRAM
ncbi:elongation factor 1-beta [Candidatus Woesearchaeota archaeon]|nr:elongation factor 1-beta [Candidatus Woesearchaeota archaeon]